MFYHEAMTASCFSCS